MSFKSRQRAKHSHLFGDDPLNASSPVTDDPLFGSSSTSPSRSPSRSPKLNDPLRKTETSNGSIFGDIDVSKLGGGSLFSSTKRSTLRNDQTLDEDALFGGSSRPQQRRPARSSSPTSTRSSLSDSGSHRSADSTSNSKPTSLAPSSPKPAAAAAAAVTPLSPPTVLPERPDASPSANSRPVERKQPPPPVPERPASRKLQQPQPPPPRLIVPEEQQHQQSQKQRPPPVPERSHSPGNGKITLQQQQQQQQSSLFSRFMVNKKKKQQQKQQDEEEQQEDVGRENDPYYDDPELLASVANDALRFDTPSMNPSVSTPQTESNPWSVVDPMKTTSSPLMKTQQDDIEPSKRTAFADLIDSWHGRKTAAIPAPSMNDDEQFFQRIAVEQRDIGFAGIQDEQHISSTSNSNHSHNHLWDIEETDNPWR